MKWIGLTGGLASGKSTVTRMLRARSWGVVDADAVAREVVAPGSVGQTEVLRAFGADLLLPDGSLDRRELGRRVFGRSAELARLEGIIHPLVQEKVRAERARLARAGARLAFYDVPLLFEKKLTGFDAVVLVACSEATQRSRLRARDGLSDAEIDARLAAQLPLSEKRRLADFVIENEGSLADLERAVDDVLARL